MTRSVTITSIPGTMEEREGGEKRGWREGGGGEKGGRMERMEERDGGGGGWRGEGERARWRRDGK